jgi:lipoate-protein ligase A
MLWRNDNAVIVGKHQNTAAEINAAYVREKGVRVVRRLSGGGAVYHDLGNVNYTFIMNSVGDRLNIALFCEPVRKALACLGIETELSGRNDMTLGGRKFSGNAQYVAQGRVMHHGTILYDSDLSVVEKALTVPKDKIESKGLCSVRSRITNIRPHLPYDVPVEMFIDRLRESMFLENALIRRDLAEEDLAGAQRLWENRYGTWEWNYGASPAYSIHKARRVEGCGRLEVSLNMSKGVITAITFHGDYFGNKDSAILAALLTGTRLEEAALRESLSGTDISHYFAGLALESFLAILLQ